MNKVPSLYPAFTRQNELPARRPHQGISQEKLPICLGFFEYVHNMGKRGKGVLQPLLELLVKQPVETG